MKRGRELGGTWRLSHLSHPWEILRGVWGGWGECVGGTELGMLLSMAREPPYSRVWGSGALCPVADASLRIGLAGMKASEHPPPPPLPSGSPGESLLPKSFGVCGVSL